MIGISPCSRDVFAPLLNKLVYVLDSLMAGHYTNQLPFYPLLFLPKLKQIESLSVTSRYHGAKKVSSKQTPKLLPRGSRRLCSKGQNLSIIE